MADVPFMVLVARIAFRDTWAYIITLHVQYSNYKYNILGINVATVAMNFCITLKIANLKRDWGVFRYVKLAYIVLQDLWRMINTVVYRLSLELCFLKNNPSRSSLCLRTYSSPWYCTSLYYFTTISFEVFLWRVCARYLHNVIVCDWTVHVCIFLWFRFVSLI